MNECFVCETVAPPARPIPGLQLMTSGSSTTVDKLSTAVTGVMPTPGSGLPTTSKSVPVTPVSTPMTEKQPSGVMSRIVAASKNIQPAVSDDHATGLQSVLLD